MADSTISGLPAGTQPTGTELIPAVQAGQTVKITIAQILDYITGSVVVPTFVDYEVPSGSLNGSNKTFGIANAPKNSNSIIGYVRLGGVGAFIPMIPGIDFTINLATKTITTTNAFATGTNLLFSYRY